MRTALLLTLIVIALAVAIVGCGRKEPAPLVDEQGKPIAQKLCPVMGDPINPHIYVDHNGRRIYFCCDACPPKFKDEPAKYLKIVDEQMKGAAPATPSTEGHEGHTH